MIEEALLTQADYEGYRDISSNIDFETRLKPWIWQRLYRTAIYRPLGGQR